MSSACQLVRYHSLKGRHVLVTGGAPGIGAELVRTCAAQGMVVGYLDVDEAAASRLAADPLAASCAGSRRIGRL